MGVSLLPFAAGDPMLLAATALIKFGIIVFLILLTPVVKLAILTLTVKTSIHLFFNIKDVFYIMTNMVKKFK